MTWTPLVGLKVLDLSRLLPGPFLTQLLRDLGADIIKVEEPRSGDYARELQGGHVFRALNKGKRSIAIDLKAPGAADLVLKLARGSDVLVESFRPGVLDRLGLPDDVLSRANPRLVRVSLVGYPRGPLRDDVGHDLNYVALSGILDAQGARGGPPIPGAAQLADVGGALYGAVGVLAALHERERTGKGRRIEIALSDAALAMHAVHLQRAAEERELPARGEWELAGGIPGYAVYEAKDGGFVALGALEPKFWDRFVKAVARAELEDAQLDLARVGDISALFRTRGRDEWVAFLRAAGVPATPVLSAHEALAHANAAPRLGGVPGPGAPLTERASEGAAPELGADADAVLREAGCSPHEIAELRARRVVH